MKKTVCALLLSVPLVLTLAAQQAPAPPPAPAKSPAGADISWAFAATNGALPAESPTTPNSVPGSTKSYMRSQIDDLNNPPDWFPDEHPPAPSIVLKGHDGALACGACHLMSGSGHPESADLSGLPAEYIRRTMMDFKSGIRVEVNRMNTISKVMSNEEIQQAADFFAKLQAAKWTEVKEVAMVPKTFVGGGRMRYASPEGGTEPIGNRIITLPADQSRVTKRDPHSGFVAYVPVGSIKKGEALVKTGGGRTVQCTICHGDTTEWSWQRAEARRPSPRVPRTPALHVQRWPEKRRRRGADEEAGREPHRRRHRQHLGVSRIDRSDEVA